ncbi:MAG: hypothetical protein HY657_06115 [Acidobacteria bacterium]|nr:hypothetical protein [Acidobacteriota bacterium]
MPRECHHLTALLPACLAALLLWAVAPLGAQRTTFTFDDREVGAPHGFLLSASRLASPGVWEVRGSVGGRHLIHDADPAVTIRALSLAVVDAPAPADIRLSTRLRLFEADRAAGLVWRYQDADNFYYLTLFLNEHRFDIARTTGGNRILLGRLADIDLDASQWHTIEVVHVGDQIRATLNGAGIVRASDRTFTEGGRAGVWSAGNSTTWFDDLTIEAASD